MKIKVGDRVMYRGDMTDVGTVEICLRDGVWGVLWDNDGSLDAMEFDLTLVDVPDENSIEDHLTKAAALARKDGNIFLANVLLAMVDSL